MKRCVILMCVLMILPMTALAQGGDYSKFDGYAFFAPGFSSPSTRTLAHVGGGGEGFFTRNLGAGAELGYLTPMSSWGDGIGTLSPNVVYRFRAADASNKLEPFVTGGYTLFFRSGTANGFNVGGGANYWLKDHLGLRFELRDNVNVQNATIPYFGFRVGVTFR